MTLSIANNTQFIQRSLASANNQVDDSMKRLSSGSRINSAKDDAAGLAIASRMQSRLASLNVAQRNAGDAISLADTADAALGQTSDLLSRMKELATQAANGSNGTGDLAQLDKEYQQLALEVTRTLTSANFNGISMLSTGAGAKDFIVGATATDKITVTTTDMTANAGIVAVVGGGLTSTANAATAMGNLDTAIDNVNTERSMYGAVQSRFSSAIAGLGTQAAALDGARGRIMDTDYASEMGSMQKTQVLAQAATAILAQANQRPSAVMTLLR